MASKICYWTFIATCAILGMILGIAALIMALENRGILDMKRANETFDNIFTSRVGENIKLNQPQAFEEEYLSSPCKPYVGCLYPMPNPINIRTGLRNKEIRSGYEVRTCSKAWRDCPSFADCVDGKCKAKKNIYKGF
jgi:hypothetical protein